MIDVIARSILTAFLIAACETLNGVFRMRVLFKRFRVRTAKAVSLVLGCAIISLLAWFLVPWVAPRTIGESLIVGGVWVAILAGYDIAVGRILVRASWAKVMSEFDLRAGNYLLLGMAYLLVAPAIVSLLRRA